MTVDREQWTLDLFTKSDGMPKRFGEGSDVQISSNNHEGSVVVDMTMGEWFTLERLRSDIWYMKIGEIESNLIVHDDGCVTILSSNNRVRYIANDYQI